jgi:hypothetical protein
LDRPDHLQSNERQAQECRKQVAGRQVTFRARTVRRVEAAVASHGAGAAIPGRFAQIAATSRPGTGAAIRPASFKKRAIPAMELQPLPFIE